MARKCVLMMALMVFACLSPAFAMREVIIVTKQTQASLGLDFTLDAEKVSDEAILVRMEIPIKGKLKTLSQVAMEIGFGKGSPQVYAPLHKTRSKTGAWVVSFQVSPEMADKCFISLETKLVPAVALTSGLDYAVELKGYVTTKKPRSH